MVAAVSDNPLDNSLDNLIDNISGFGRAVKEQALPCVYRHFRQSV